MLMNAFIRNLRFGFCCLYGNDDEKIFLLHREGIFFRRSFKERGLVRENESIKID